MLSVSSRQSPRRQSSRAATTTADEIQRWKEDSLDNEYLCRQDVLKEHFFWNLIQCQKDQLYNFYVEEETRLIENTISWTDIAKKSLKEVSSQAVINSHIVHLTFLLEQVQMFQEFVQEREDDFIEVLNAYDNCHGTNVRPSELYELRTTHTFLKGRRLNELETELKECILPLEEAVEKLDNCGTSRHGSLGRSFKRGSIMFGSREQSSIKSTISGKTDRTRGSLTSSNGLVPLEGIPSDDNDGQQLRTQGSIRKMKGKFRSSLRRIFRRSHSI